MRDFRDAKAMAQTLREVLAVRAVSLTHSESLELIAKILGFRDWNVMSARIQSQPRPLDATSTLSTPANLILPVVPLKDIVLFPDMVTPIFIGREKTKHAVEQAVVNDCCILGVSQRRITDETVSADTLYQVGVTAKVLDFTPLADGTFRSIIKSLERVNIAHFAEGRCLSAEITPIEETRGHDPKAYNLMRSVLENLEAYLNIDFSMSTVPYARLPHIREPGTFADVVAPFLSIEIDRRQDLLETGDVIARLEKILTVVTADRDAA
jgi:ATP-dependent Lon protease